MSIGNFPESLSQQILVGIINLSREIGRSIMLRVDPEPQPGGLPRQLPPRRWRSLSSPSRRPARTRARTVAMSPSSELHKQGHMTTGHWLFCKKFLRFNTMPCRHMPLLVYF